MIDERFEPKGLDPATPSLHAAKQLADRREDAVVGSQRLLVSLLRAQGVYPKRKTLSAPNLPRKYKKRPTRKGANTWKARQRAREETFRIQGIVAGHFGLSIADMTKARGLKKLVEARQMAMYLARTTTTASYEDIGACFGGRDHTTIRHGFLAVEERLTYDIRVRRDVEMLRKRLAA